MGRGVVGAWTGRWPCAAVGSGHPGVCFSPVSWPPRPSPRCDSGGSTSSAAGVHQAVRPFGTGKLGRPWRRRPKGAGATCRAHAHPPLSLSPTHSHRRRRRQTCRHRADRAGRGQRQHERERGAARHWRHGRGGLPPRGTARARVCTRATVVGAAVSAAWAGVQAARRLGIESERAASQKKKFSVFAFHLPTHASAVFLAFAHAGTNAREPGHRLHTRPQLCVPPPWPPAH